MYEVNLAHMLASTIIHSMQYFAIRLLFLFLFTIFCSFLTAPSLTASSSCANSLLRVSNTSGIISSRSYPPWSFSNHVDCHWNISFNAMLQLVFVRFKTQTSDDSLTVYDGVSSSSPLIGTFNGSSLPAPITSLSGNLHVRCKFHGSGNNRGFEAHYRGMHAACEQRSQKSHKVLVKLN